MGFPCENYNFGAAGQTWKSGCEEIKFGNHEFEQGSSYENDALQAAGQQPGIWKRRFVKGSPNESVTFQAASAKTGDENTIMSEPLVVNILILY